MLKYITADDYKELLGTESIPDNFDNLVIRASAYINRKTYGRIDETSVEEEVKYATCLIVDLINEKVNLINNIGSLKGENIEGWSVSYQNSSDIEVEYETKMYDVLQTYLWNIIGADGNPLLFRGVELYE